MAMVMPGLLLTGLLCALVDAASLRRSASANVPKGECYECEVTCFEDCLLKYDREIIQVDVEDAKKAERKKRKEMRAKSALLQIGSSNRTNTTHVIAHEARVQPASANETARRGGGVFNWRHRVPTVAQEVNRFDAVISTYEKCLEAERCHGHRATKRLSRAPWAAKARTNPACTAPGQETMLLQGGASHCTSLAPACSAKTCLAKAAGHLALTQEGHVPLHPVKVNTFAKGQQGLEACFKSCLAATCGCNDAPGFDAIAKLDSQIKANDANGDPVEDTPPEYDYRPAMKDECAGGMAGLKISSGLYTALAKGWLEVCTPAYLKAMYVDEKEGAKKCKSNDPANAEYGCVWNTDKGACVWGLKPVARCSVRFLHDAK